MEILEWKKHGAEFGFVGIFSVILDNKVMLAGIKLIRPAEQPDQLWMAFPQLDFDKLRAFSIPAKLRNQIGDRAAALYFATTGLDLKYTPPPRKTAGKPEPKPEPADDAGLRRVVGEEIEDALTIAGMGN
jgi:hypothetical protein